MRRLQATVPIRAIALNTFREAIRDRVMYLLLAFALILIGVSRILSQLTVGGEEKIIKDIGLSAIAIFGVLTTVFVGTSLVFKEIERRTVYTLLANPVARWQFVVGKYLGLLSVLAMNLGLMFAALALILAMRGESPWSLLPAVVLILVELSVVASFSLLFSSLTSSMLAALATMTVYLVGHLVWSVELLRERLEGTIGTWICDAMYWGLPNLDRLDIKNEVVNGFAVDSGYVMLAAAYGVVYSIVVLALACAAFERKEFL